ncbi:hypothetical protein HK098_003467 [Nowakowskiella sp. JEL0407]|nr:hypothetical protein HK098_003467 [Nowakowskiella sp. JEL0407]
MSPPPCSSAQPIFCPGVVSVFQCNSPGSTCCSYDKTGVCLPLWVCTTEGCVSSLAGNPSPAVLPNPIPSSSAAISPQLPPTTTTASTTTSLVASSVNAPSSSPNSGTIASPAYNPKSSPIASPVNNSGTVGEPQPQNTTNVVAVVVACVSSTLVIVGIAFFLIMRRRRTRKSQNVNPPVIDSSFNAKPSMPTYQYDPRINPPFQNHVAMNNTSAPPNYASQPSTATTGSAFTGHSFGTATENTDNTYIQDPRHDNLYIPNSHTNLPAPRPI